MAGYKYELEKYSGPESRYDCPSCSKRKVFTRYVYTATGLPVDPVVGICNRKSNCGYHFPPKQYFRDNKTTPLKNVRLHKVIKETKRSSFIPFGKFKNSLLEADGNNFVTYLDQMFGKELADRLVEKYYIGTSNYWLGATIFWQIDLSGRIRTGKIMLYNPDSGKRVKEPFNHINWVHNTIKKQGFQLAQCFFGEHLLKERNKSVAIVESEKTAIIASALMPKYIWLATGSLTNLNADRCQVLQGRKVTLYPDLKGYEKWSSIANGLSHIARFTVSDYLEKIATEEERQQGLDIADYLIQHYQKHNAATQFSSLVAEFKGFCDLVVHREKPAEENLAYTLDMERRLKEHGIPLVDFVKATM